MTRGRIIDGEVHDASQLAERIVASARASATAIVDDARRAADALVQATREQHATAAAHSAIGESAPAVDEAEASDRDTFGKVAEVIGLTVRAEIPGVVLGEQVYLDRARGGPVAAEVVGFRGDLALLFPLGDVNGIAATSRVARTRQPASIRCGDDLLGRVVDGLGDPIDGGAPLVGERWAICRTAPPPLARPAIERRLVSGVRAIDGLLTLGEGQRIGVFAGAGVGKSTLLSQIAVGAAADVCVVCLVGERGRELGDLLRGPLAQRRERMVVVCATADAPALVRVRAAHVATAIAEWFRDRRGARVLLLVDSLTRVARAQREVGLASGEAPTRHGYPPSVFATLPQLVERAGTAAQGSITGVYTVLVAGGDLDEPIADETRALLDGHIVLDRKLAGAGQFPPIDILESVSRVMSQITDAEHQQIAQDLRRNLALYEDQRDLISLGAYKPGSDKAVDQAILNRPHLLAFLTQRNHDASAWDETYERLLRLFPSRP